MSTTTNYNLYLCDDDTKKFIDWRQEMNGVTDSNMIKIDTALGEKADHSVSIPLTLFADNWVADNEFFTQQLTVPNLTAVQDGSIAMANTATTEQYNAACEAIITIKEQTEGQLVVISKGVCPSVDIPVVVILLG